MPDENGQAATESAAESTESTTAAPTKLLGDDGTFVKGWTEQLDADIRGEKCLQTFKDIKGMAKSLVNAQRMVGKNKIAIPTDTSSESEWEAYYEAGGRPKTPQDYQIAKPKDVPDELFNADLVQEATILFHKLGLSKKQAQALVEFNIGKASVAMKQQADAAAATLKEVTEGLRKEWGAAYDQKLHLGNAAIEQGAGGNAEFKDRLTAKFGNDPDFVRFAASLGEKFSEHGVVVSRDVDTPIELKAKIDDLMAQPAYMNGNHPGHKAAVAAVAKLFAEKAKSERRG